MIAIGHSFRFVLRAVDKRIEGEHGDFAGESFAAGRRDAPSPGPRARGGVSGARRLAITRPNEHVRIYSLARVDEHELDQELEILAALERFRDALGGREVPAELEGVEPRLVLQLLVALGRDVVRRVSALPCHDVPFLP